MGSEVVLNEAATIDITKNVETILGVGTQVMNFIIANPLLLTMFCGSLVGLGVYVIRKIKSVSKR